MFSFVFLFTIIVLILFFYSTVKLQYSLNKLFFQTILKRKMASS